MTVSSVRIAPDAATVSQKLGLIADLAGTWAGDGFNLIARPDHADGTPLYLQLNQTRETLEITPIGSPVPNRGFGMDDLELHGLTYLQKIRDAATGGAMHNFGLINVPGVILGWPHISVATLRKTFA